MKIPTFKQSNLDWSGLEVNLPSPTGGQYIAKGIQNLGNSLKRRQAKLDRTFLQDKKNKLSNQRRQEHIENVEANQLGDARDFTKKELTRVEKDREGFMKDIPGRLRGEASIIFNSVNKSHLDKTATQIEILQTKKWQETTEAQTILDAQEEAIALSIGKVPELFNLLDGLINSLPDAPIKAQLHSKDILVNTFRAWARVNPNGAEQFAIAYNSQIQERLGTDFNKLGRAIEEGRRLHEMKKETDYKWSQRKLTENQEATTKEGVTIFLKPDQKLTPDWIVSKKDSLTNTQMRILYGLLKVQNTTESMTIQDVDWNTYGRLISMVKDDDVRKLGEINMIDQIVYAINKQITPSQGQDLLKLVAATPKLDTETQRGLTYIKQLQLDRNKNVDAMMKNKAVDRFLNWRAANPQGDVTDYIDNVINPEVEADVRKDLNQQLDDMSVGKQLLYETDRPMAPLSAEDTRRIIVTIEELERSKLPSNILAPMGIPDIRNIKKDPKTQRVIHEMILRKEEQMRNRGRR